MRSTFCLCEIAIIIYGEENVSCTRKVWEGGTKRERVGLSHQHEGHRGAEEDDIGIGVLFEVFVLEISILDACLVIALAICPRQL